ncbi:MAG: vWA domain-containing protein [Gemmatimonadaceae bacterium]
MARKGRRLAVILIVFAALYVTTRSRIRVQNAAEETSADTTATGRFAPTVQEGLGASVAILLDQSGSMDDPPGDGGEQPKYVLAREALAQVMAQTDTFVAKQTGFPVNIGLYTFDSRVRKVLPIAPYDRAALQSALESLPKPSGNTAIGDAMSEATRDLYAAGTIRKYLLVVTDGENTAGREPDEVAREIARRSEGAVKLYLVAFDIDAEKFGFVNEVRGAVMEAKNAVALRANLDTLYRGRILAEAMDAGESLPSRPDSSGSAARSTPPRQR